MGDQVIRAISVNNTATMSERATVRMRSPLSMQHIEAAALFARQCGVIEREYAGKLPGQELPDEVFGEHRAYAMGAITFAALFVEATINELFTDAADRVEHRTKHLAPEIVSQMAAEWAAERGVSRVPTLAKYTWVLTAAGKPLFERGRRGYQDVQSLIELRDALIHFKPEWAAGGSARETDRTTSARLQARLHGRFDINPLTGAGNPFFPDKCLGHGGARWAVETAIAFADDFFARMEVPPFHDLIRARLDAG